MEQVTDGLVLREVKVGEADKILTIFSPQLGIINASARGSRRLKSKLFSGCGLFCYSEFTLSSGRNTWFVQQATVKRVFHGIGASVGGMALAAYLAELTSLLPLTEKEAPRQMRLLLNSLYLISEQKKPLWQIKAVYELRTMTLNGYMPQLLCCRDCHKYDGDGFLLEYQGGELLCRDCAARENKMPNLDQGSLKALRYICLMEDDQIFSFELKEKSIPFLCRVAEEYTIYQMERPVKSLGFYHSVL